MILIQQCIIVFFYLFIFWIIVLLYRFSLFWLFFIFFWLSKYLYLKISLGNLFFFFELSFHLPPLFIYFLIDHLVGSLFLVFSSVSTSSRSTFWKIYQWPRGRWRGHCRAKGWWPRLIVQCAEALSPFNPDCLFSLCDRFFLYYATRMQMRIEINGEGGSVWKNFAHLAFSCHPPVLHPLASHSNSIDTH